ncbi:hypothetical protein [Bathymodiolus thermophilus thioautotrophic gill symbiont]|uniref:Uncharacterized protein n=1 Tax=Bathymodiolus thermophilus thioautotrophic gill symbiont TaxID=2360 RepID=A0A8H8XF27_9GAMM|nr:hypothetical protein [Bathymodiolus thermophilus thioautotrophic gill symbiont]CAB5504348.1 hypothetical protein THERMOS_1942 [Bathymodiolus thermophilus thioautotrophic gill symbiont]
MLINNSKTREPIAVWFLQDEIDIDSKKQLPPPQEITLGWDSFRKKLKEENILYEEIKDERWIEKPTNEQHYYEDFGREKLLVGKYVVIDGCHSLTKKINTSTNITVDNLNICLFNNILILGRNQTYDRSSCLFFNAKPKYRENILNGKQPLREARYYRESNDHSNDPMEGLLRKQSCHTHNIGEIYFEQLPSESYIFSLHDNPDGIEKFGSDLFKINDVVKWVNEIYLQVDNYWLLKRDDYVGCIIYFDKVAYSNNKEIEKLGLLTESETNHICKMCNINVNEKINKPIAITEYILANHFFKALELGLLTKPLEYEHESEVRLIVTPMFSNKDKDGYLLNEHEGESSIDMNLKGSLVSLINQ